MSLRLRATPWWEQCEQLGHMQGCRFCGCPMCASAARRRVRLVERVLSLGMSSEELAELYKGQVFGIGPPVSLWPEYVFTLSRILYRHGRYPLRRLNVPLTILPDPNIIEQ